MFSVSDAVFAALKAAAPAQRLGLASDSDTEALLESIEQSGPLARLPAASAAGASGSAGASAAGSAGAAGGGEGALGARRERTEVRKAWVEFSTRSKPTWKAMSS